MKVKPERARGEDLNQRWKQARTALMWAAIAGNLGSVQSLLTNGADLNQKDGNNQTALMFAAQSGNLAMVEILLQSGADPLARDMNCATSYDRAIKKDSKGFPRLSAISKHQLNQVWMKTISEQANICETL